MKMHFFRDHNETVPGTPYLTACRKWYYKKYGNVWDHITKNKKKVTCLNCLKDIKKEDERK